MIYLYVKTHNVTGMKYLGKTTSNDPYKYMGSGLVWKRHIAKYGRDISTTILLATKDKKEIKETGIFFSKLWNIIESEDWANLTEEQGQGGKIRIGWKHTEETKRKMSLRAKVRKSTRIGILHTEETKRKISQTKSGKKWSPEVRERMVISHANRESLTCPHCGTTAKVNTAKQWHFDNCKFKALSLMGFPEPECRKF